MGARMRGFLLQDFLPPRFHTSVINAKQIYRLDGFVMAAFSSRCACFIGDI
jgi:hypothetical protein